MIFTCTMNPAIDLFCAMDSFIPDAVNRSNYEEYQPNGKGINVSITLKKLGVESTTLGFLGGFTGDFIKKSLNDMNINNNFVKSDGITRINTFVQSENGEFKIVNNGPEIKKNRQTKLLDQIKKLTAEDILFVSGSLPKGVSNTIFIEIAEISVEKGFKLIWDISDPILEELIKYRPYMIKPNVDEFKQIFLDDDVVTNTTILKKGRTLLENGVENIVISNGKDGAWFLNDEKLIEVSAPKGKVVNTACSGDTLLATFFATYNETGDDEKSLIKAVAAGSSTAFRPGLTNFDDITELMNDVQVMNIEKV